MSKNEIQLQIDNIIDRKIEAYRENIKYAIEALCELQAGFDFISSMQYISQNKFNTHTKYDTNFDKNN